MEGVSSKAEPSRAPGRSRWRRRRSWLASAGAALVLGPVGIALIAADAPSDPGHLLDCDRYQYIIGEYGPQVITGTTPEAAIQASGLAKALDLAPDTMKVAEEESPEFGLVELAAAADGTVSEGEQDGEVVSFLAFEEGKRVAHVDTELTPEGAYWVSAIRAC